MKYRAKIGFSGLVSMRKGEIKEISVKYIAKDLLKAGYIEPAVEETEVETTEEETEVETTEEETEEETTEEETEEETTEEETEEETEKTS